MNSISMSVGTAGGSNGGSITMKAGDSLQSAGGNVAMRSGIGGVVGGSLTLAVQLNEDSISSDSSSTTENSLDEEDSGNDSDSLMDLDSLSDEAIAIGIVKFGTRRQRHSPSTA